MKKIVMILALAAGVLLAASCGKTIEVPQQTGFTLTASIANPAPSTKTTYNDSGEGTLSVGWAAEEKLSLVIWDPSEGIIKNYILTSSGTDGNKNRDFSTDETVDPLASGQKYFCIYPAMTTSTDGYYKYETAYSEPLVYDKSNKKLTYTATAVQTGTSSPAHLKDIDLLMGEATVSGNSASVVLQRQVGVLKLVIKVPSEWRTAEKTFQGFSLLSMTPFFYGEMEADFSTGKFNNLTEKVPFILVQFSSPVPSPSSDQFIIYVACGANTLEKDYSFFPTFMIEEGHGFRHKSGIKASVDIPIEVGKMTTLTIDASGSDEWQEMSAE